jgi:hypothetical protein
VWYEGGTQLLHIGGLLECRRVWQWGTHMQVEYTRLFADDDGASRFEDLTVGLQPGFSAPGVVTTIFSAPFQPSDGSFWIGAPTTWIDDTPHPAPRRMVLVTTRGEYQVTTSSGEARKFPVGSVVMVEDITGAGHSTKVTSTEDVIIFAVGLPAAQR